ncbi:MAG: phage integrase N-terminal SAM-like domain-containing protein [Saprospiraceae bacterium]|nr:phage integrase N-terminal SAM-like domain-containing protein [Saprospiraceae bacterium]
MIKGISRLYDSKKFSPRTVKTYYQIVHYFLEYCESVFPDKEICDDLVREYLLHRFEMKLDWQTVNSDYSSIQKYFKNVLFLP